VYGGYASGHRGVQGHLGPRDFNLRWRDLQNAVKGVVYIYTPLLLLTYLPLYIMGYDHHIKNRSHDCRGPAKA
jgi:hypothetical protein